LLGQGETDVPVVPMIVPVCCGVMMLVILIGKRAHLSRQKRKTCRNWSQSTKHWSCSLPENTVKIKRVIFSKNRFLHSIHFRRIYCQGCSVKSDPCHLSWWFSDPHILYYRTFYCIVQVHFSKINGLDITMWGLKTFMIEPSIV
jgi:hypothetical protein